VNYWIHCIQKFTTEWAAGASPHDISSHYRVHSNPGATHGVSWHTLPVRHVQLTDVTLELGSRADLAALEPGQRFCGGLLVDVDLDREQAVVTLYEGDALELEQGAVVKRKRLRLVAERP
jgi:hypothetical protein